MRIIPKRTRLQSTVWLNFSLIDIVIIALMFVIVAIIIMSNLPYKWAIALVVAGLFIIMMMGDDEQRIYMDFATILKYAVSKKHYAKKEIDKLIPFDDVDKDGVVSYGTYYGAVIEVGSIEFSLLGEFEQNLIIKSLGKILSSASLSTTLQFVKIDRPIKYDEIAYWLNNKITAEERHVPRDEAKIDILKNRLIQVDSLNNLQPQFRPFYYIVVYENTRENVVLQRNMIIDAINALELPCKQLDDTHTALFMKYCFTRNFDERDIWNFEGTISDYVKPQDVKFGVQTVQVDDTYTFTYAIRDYPLSVGNAWGADIFNIDNTKVVLTMKPVDKMRGIKRIDRVVTELASRRQRKASEMIDQQTHFETMRELLISLSNENETLFDCSLTVTGFVNEKKSIAAFRHDVRRQIQSGGFKVNILRGRQFEGYVNSAISRRTLLKRFERGINSESLAAVFPFVFSSIIENDGIVLGHNDYPVVLDIWKRDDMHNNSNIITLGKSGSGKSYFTKSLLTSLYSDNVQMYVLDPENEYNELCDSLKGKMIDVGNASEGRLNPLQIYPILTDEGEPASPESIYSAHLRFLENFFSITLTGITSDSLEELNNLLGRLYQDYKIYPDTDCTEFDANQFPTFDALLKVVEREYANERLPVRQNNLARVKTYIEKFATGGRYSQLWNGPSTLSANENFVVFNFQSLFESKNTIVSNAQSLVVFRWLEQKIINTREQNRVGNNIRTAIVVDEGHLFVDPKYPIALDFMYLQAKRIRKYNGLFYLATQNLADLTGNPETAQKTSAIFNNCQYAFFFSLAPADINLLSDLYALSGGINETERNAIATAKRGDCFAVLSSRQRAIFRVRTPYRIERYFMSSEESDMTEYEEDLGESYE